MSSQIIGQPRPRLRRSTKSGHLPVAALTASAVLVAVGGASGADMPVKAPPPPVFNWTGCYLGVNGGAASAGSNFTSGVDPGTHLVDPGDLATVASIGTGSANEGNFLGGGQAGCNLQTGSLVFGLEGDWDYVRINALFNDPNGTLSTGDTVAVRQSLQTRSFATVRPRLGIVSNRELLYVTGGVAFADVSYSQTYSDTIPGSGGASASSTLIGWTAGAGFEWAWLDHWTVKTEYLFAKFPALNAVGSITDGAGGANVLHGSADPLVPSSEALKLQHVLETKGVPYEMKIYPNQGHGFTGQASVDAASRALAFFDRFLKGPAQSAQQNRAR